MPTHRTPRHARRSTTAADPLKSSADYHSNVAGYVESFKPSSPEEFSLIEQAVIAHMHVRKSWEAEAAAWNHALAEHNGSQGHAFKALAESGEIERILDEEERWSDQYHNALEKLISRRNSRRLKNQAN